MSTTTDGQLLFTGSSITDGQGVWQSIGGQEIGTVWGHGAYVAPDWSADWLHRESEYSAEHLGGRARARQISRLSDQDQQAIVQGAPDSRDAYQYLRRLDAIESSLSADRAAAFEQLRAYYTDVSQRAARIRDPERRIDQRRKAASTCRILLVDFMGCSTDRPGSETTYTNNWPHEPLIGNVPTSGAVLWSVLSFVGLLAGIGGLVWWYASQEKELVHGPYPERDPFLGFQADSVATRDFEVLLSWW